MFPLPRLIVPAAALAALLFASRAWALEVLDAPADLKTSVTADELKTHVGWLADDERTGRKIGTPGNEAAAEYIANAFKDAGLAPIGDEGGYLQHFEATGVMSLFGGGGPQKGHNVVGWLEGSDPALKHEHVIVGAHYDHLGMGGGMMSGALDNVRAVHNGADDNASGTAVVLELAQAFGLAGTRPKRSVLFLAFDGEESGLLGSAHYARNALKPIGDAAFMLNLDMVGRLRNRRVQVIGTQSSDGFLDLVQTLAGAAGLEVSTQELIGGDSDHSSFLRAGVPALFMFTGMHPQYHRATDDLEHVNAEGMKTIADLSATLLWHFAATAERPALNPDAVRAAPGGIDLGNLQDLLQNLFGGRTPGGQGGEGGPGAEGAPGAPAQPGGRLRDMLRNLFGGGGPGEPGTPPRIVIPGRPGEGGQPFGLGPRPEGGPAPTPGAGPGEAPVPAPGGVPAAERPRLGVSIAATPDGLYVQDVTPDTPAARAGVQAGDRLVLWDGEELADFEALRARVQAAVAGSAHTLTIERAGEPQELKISFAAPAPPKPRVEDF